MELFKGIISIGLLISCFCNLCGAFWHNSKGNTDMEILCVAKATMFYVMGMGLE